jgi:hypothetical protein
MDSKQPAAARTCEPTIELVNAKGKEVPFAEHRDSGDLHPAGRRPWSA